jgi:hypothetical protein
MAGMDPDFRWDDKRGGLVENAPRPVEAIMLAERLALVFGAEEAAALQ